MANVTASITTSLDGYIAAPNDGPGNGLGDGGERLHYWVFGGPWSSETGPRGEATGPAREFLESAAARTGAIVVGRWMYECADHWGDRNPFGVPVFVVTHRPEEEPDTGEFSFAGSFEEAIDGGASVIRQGLEAGVVDELAIIVAPVILGEGKPLFDGFRKSVHLEPIGVQDLELATVLAYRVKR